MTNPVLKDQILRTDSRGRVKTPAERREALLDEFERSGLSGMKFAALVGIKYQTFGAWATKRRKQRGSAQNPAQKPAESVPRLQWLEAVVEKERDFARPKGLWVERAFAGRGAHGDW